MEDEEQDTRPAEQVWAVSMVRNEADILPYTISHLIYEGIDGFVIADNLSEDETPDILEMLRAAAKVPIHLLRDEVVAFQQSQKMTALANVAADLGATYILPFDADELWYSYHNDLRLADLVRQCSESVIGVSVWRHVRTRLDIPSPNPIISMGYRDVKALDLSKVIVKWEPGYRLREGNHGVWNGLGETIPGAATQAGIRHYPFRNPKQFLRRIKDSVQSYRFAKMNKTDHVHKRVYATKIWFCGEEAALKDYESWIRENPDNPECGLVWDPGPLYGSKLR